MVGNVGVWVRVCTRVCATVGSGEKGNKKYEVELGNNSSTVSFLYVTG